MARAVTLDLPAIADWNAGVARARRAYHESPFGIVSGYVAFGPAREAVAHLLADGCTTRCGRYAGPGAWRTCRRCT